MLKRFSILAVVLALVAGLTLAAAQQPKESSWTGYVTDTMCGAKGTSAKHASCAGSCVKEHGAKYALYNTADKKVYVLDPQDKAAEHAGHYVTVKGTVDGNTIKVTSITMTEEPKEKT